MSKLYVSKATEYFDNLKIRNKRIVDYTDENRTGSVSPLRVSSCIRLNWLILFLLWLSTDAFVPPTPLARLHKSVTVASASNFFAELDGQLTHAEQQSWLRRDIGRRRTELLILGWLGRAYLVATPLFEALLPKVFKFDLYEGEDLMYETETTAECVLRESSVVGRGVPLRLRLARDTSGAVSSAELLAVGCDVTPLYPRGAKLMGADDSLRLVSRLNDDRVSKRLVVEAVVATIFYILEPLFATVGSGADATPIKSCGEVVAFTSKRDLWAREGSAEKWLQRVSAYYFADALLREVRFAGVESMGECRFTFYLDPTEPPNSENAYKNVNPEVICCKFPGYFSDVS